MAYRKSAGSIAVTTIEAMEKKGWQNSIFLDRGKNRIIVAVDREEGDFTILRLAYMLLRQRILLKSTSQSSAKSGISPDKIKQVIADIESDMSSVKKIRQTISDIEGRMEDMRSEITNFSGKIRKRQEDLQELID
jgi:septal ring factor EnvC (AmiA/AmiB activator)